jgi:hypothetical protein
MTPMGGSANLIYAYYSLAISDSEIPTGYLNIVRSEESYSIPITTADSFFNLFNPPCVAISPDASRIMVLAPGENGSELLEINLQKRNPYAQFIVEVPENPWITDLGFSPNGKWVYVNLHFYGRNYVGFLEIGTEKLLISYDCKWVIDFLNDETAICRTGLSVNEMGEFSLESFSMQGDFIKLPPQYRFFQATNHTWNFWGVVPQMNSFVMLAGQKYHLVQDLDYYNSLSYWYREDIENFVNSPTIAELPWGVNFNQFLSSPDNKKIAVIGNNSESRSIAWGIPPGTFSFVVNLGEVYEPDDPDEPGTVFYPLHWSPDSRVLVGLSDEGKSLIIWNPETGDIEEIIKFSEQTRIKYQNVDIFGIDALWLH